MFRSGDKVLIGGKKAIPHHYTKVVGKVCTYKEAGGYSHEVSYDGDDMIWSTWYIQECDLLPIQLENNQAAAIRLLKKDT